MHHITLDGEIDFDGWRKAARALALNDVKPSDVIWNVAGDAPELFAPTPTPLEPPEGTFNVSARCRARGNARTPAGGSGRS